MKHYLFTVIGGVFEGEDFIVGADDLAEARDIANTVFDSDTKVRFICELSEMEAEISGLDEY